MNFWWVLALQLNETVGKNIEVATDTALFEGILVKIENDVIKLEETLIGYERETRFTFIPLSSVNFIKIQL
ncbi:hypothetical protein [Priestia megaterium]|uniref:hypothetical protein n=1 Tax=Priestia megaterium TaxID=1404 RepID=UPI00203FE6B5|nr:hypothetical protein [Priestia megaterium]MCM3544079.1 hypothetical protein [Priestia megaterium]